MIRLSGIKIPASLEVTDELLLKRLCRALRTKQEEILSFNIAKKSIDARNKSSVFYVLSLDIELKNEKKYIKCKNVSVISSPQYTFEAHKTSQRPIIVGFGPAGMFASLMLARAGCKPIILERGKCVEERDKDVELFLKTGSLNTESNVQFGEGGAGTYSDGKLTTGINDIRCRLVLKELVSAGAPDEILYDAKPHIGTDRLKQAVKNIRAEIISLGGEILFEHKLTDIGVKDGHVQFAAAEHKGQLCELSADSVILAVGHSARDTFQMLLNKQLAIVPKPFAVGVRVEHKQSFINTHQYGDFSKFLPAADYKLAVHLKNGRGIFTFCMCPGGTVIAAASEKNMVVTNGMSYYSRDGENANSALLIGISPQDFNSASPLAGVELQRMLERRAFIAGGGDYSAPVQLIGDLLNDRTSTSLGDIMPTYKPGVRLSNMREIFPDYIYSALKAGIIEMDNKIDGFAQPDAVLTAVESRSSSPIRIMRSSSHCSDIIGLYPCGEGCGYAGGIISAAVDGIRTAECLMQNSAEGQ